MQYKEPRPEDGRGYLFYSSASSALGAIFRIFSDSRQTVAKANSTRQMPAMMINPTGTVKVHLTMPIPLKNNAVNGLIRKAHTVKPTAAERMVAGINDAAVCKINCRVVKPSAFMMP